MLEKTEAYGHEKPKYENLEKAHKSKVQFLRQHSAEEGFCLYLARMSCSIGSDGQKEISFPEVVDVDGNLKVEDVYIEESNVIQEDVFDDRESLDSDYDEEDYEIPHRYRDLVRHNCDFCPSLRYSRGKFEETVKTYLN